MYSTRHLAEMFGTSRETIRNWAREFSAYLSPSATPGKGRNRTYTHEDVQVFALIAESKRHGLVFEEIHPQLQGGQRGEVPEAPPDELSVVSRSEKIVALQNEVNALQDQLRLTIESLRQEQVATNLLKEQLAGERAKVEELSRLIGKLQAQIDLLKDDD